MKKKLVYFIGLVGFILLLTACGKDQVGPVAITETDTCAICNMAVADNQHATQIILENSKSLVFDDIGCMYKWIDENENEKTKAQFVRDFHDKEWISADNATYVYNQSVKTPMAYNMISFKDKATAEKFMTENEGSILLTATELSSHNWERNQNMMQGHHQENHSHSEAPETNQSNESH